MGQLVLDQECKSCSHELVWCLHLTEADQHLHEIEKCCGCCVCPWNRVNSPTRVKVQKKSYGSSMKPPVVTSQPKRSHGGNGKGATGVEGGYIQTVTNDDRENEMNDNLGSVKEYLSASSYYTACILELLIMH